MFSRTIRRTAVGLLAATTLATSACSGSDTSSAPKSSSAASTVTRPDPFVVAAAAVGTRSRTQVVSLHATATSTASRGGVPHAELPRQGAAIRAALRGQIADATRLPPPAGSASARLVTALRSYATLAGRVAAWNPHGPALPRQWFATLRTTDTAWKQAMHDLSLASGRDLLAGLPKLLTPAS